MFLLELISWNDIGGTVRKIFLLLDSIGLTFIDDAYKLMLDAISAFDGNKIAEIANDISKNCYIIIGVFALFRIALILVNTIINPDKLTDKEQGFGKMITRLVITMVLFVTAPLLFDMSREVQKEIVQNNYISKLLIGTSLVGEDKDSNGDAGLVMQDVAVRSLIRPNENFYDEENYDETNRYASDNCKSETNDECFVAVKNWKNDASFDTINMHIDEYYTVGDEEIFVYDYTPFVTLLVGGFITYVLFSFAIDIAMRSVELAVLEILSPMFIVTYIDPKSSTSGPFKKWLSACGKTYLNLFIKIAIICLMLLFISKIHDIFLVVNDSSGLLQLLVYIAILLFAKKAPKWLGDMLGIDGSSLGGLGIGKKLAGAALVGGAIKKGTEAVGKFTKQKGKNFLGNRARNTLARVGGMREAAATNKARKKSSPDGQYQRESLWKQGRAAAKQAKADNYGKDIKGFKDISSGYMAGRKNVNEQAQTIKQNMDEKFQLKNADFQAKVGNTDVKRAEQLDFANKKATASKLYKASNFKMDPSGNGDRLQVKNAAGKDVYLNPQGAKEMNAAFGNPKTATSAFTEFGRNLATHQGLTINGDMVRTKDGNDMRLAEFGAQNMSRAGRLAIDNLVSENVERDVQNYKQSKANLNDSQQKLSSAIIQRNQMIERADADPRMKDVQKVFENTPDRGRVLGAVHHAQTTIAKIQGNEDYQKLKNSDAATLSVVDQKRLQEYEHNISIHQETINNHKDVADALTLRDKIVREEYNLEFFDKQLHDAKAEYDKMEQTVKEFEKRFKETKSDEFDFETGKVKSTDVNPYEVTVLGGGKYNVVDDFARISEIQLALSTKTSSAKKKYEESLKSAQGKDE